ncbi:DUF512 domain-containing protein [Zongyangia hominis]|uniref:DUF512 domain-containing protein n=1 Tax=Zongyangia hominis TaxID=2763677 RepID=A0A926EFL0_9FIRM|nr:DUF512 domain-containing protein [Zongyangia hominis]MBC8570941.1 DUF512 domain-containing protein [Zongyangia hominis]
MAVSITQVQPGSPADRCKIAPGETLVSINGHPIADVLDYRFYMTEERLLLELERDGRRRRVRVRKDEYEDLGLEFATYLMDRQHSCKNKCIFCFVDQMPPGMRDSLYFKDDDDRLSFFFGNYITMTNLSPQEIERIIKMRISPINISVHTTDPALRVKMMKNPRAADSLAYIERLCEAGIKVNTQLVLCPGINDGPFLEKSLRDLGGLYPGVQSIACVPVGITRFREGLYPLTTYTEAQARQVVATINAFGDDFERRYGSRICYPSDEFYLQANLPLPGPDYYGDFDQLENGVGLFASLESEIDWEINNPDGRRGTGEECTIATGVGAAPFIRRMAEKVAGAFEGVKPQVFAIENRFFGPTITVAGLVTATDLIEQLRGRSLGKRLLLPAVMLRHEQDRFLDDATVEDVETALGVEIRLIENDGADFVSALLGE